MKASTTIIGAVFGVATAGLLGPALYLDVPRAFISDWTLVSREVGLGCTLGAAAVLVLCGMAGAWADPDRPARSAALAGFIAATIALVTVGLPAAGVIAHGDLIGSLESGRATALELKRGIAVSAVLVPFYQTLAGLGLLLSGLVLSWLGGMVYDLWRGAATRAPALVRPSPVPWLGLAGGLAAVPSLLAGIVAVEQLVFVELGGKSTWQGQAQLTSPLILGAALMGACLYVIARDAVIVRRAGQRGRAVVWLLAVVALLGVQALVSIPVYWQVVITPGGWGAIFLFGVCPIAGLLGGRFTTADLETAPRVFGEMLAEAMVTATLLVTLVALHGTSAGMLIGLISAPWVEVLAGGQATIDTQTASDVIHQAYLAHLAFPALMAAIVTAYMVVAVPVWMGARALRSR